MSHSYTGPSGKRYHLDAAGSPSCGVHFALKEATPYEPEEVEVEIPMDDILFLAAIHVRSRFVELAESGADLEVLATKLGASLRI